MKTEILLTPRRPESIFSTKTLSRGARIFTAWGLPLLSFKKGGMWSTRHKNTVCGFLCRATNTNFSGYFPAGIIFLARIRRGEFICSGQTAGEETFFRESFTGQGYHCRLGLSVF